MQKFLLGIILIMCSITCADAQSVIATPNDFNPLPGIFGVPSPSIAQAKLDNARNAVDGAKADVANVLDSDPPVLVEPFDEKDELKVKLAKEALCEAVIWELNDEDNAGGEIGGANIGFGRRAFCWPAARMRAAILHEGIHFSQFEATIAQGLSQEYLCEYGRLSREIQANLRAKKILEIKFGLLIPWTLSQQREYYDSMVTLLESAKGYANDGRALRESAAGNAGDVAILTGLENRLNAVVSKILLCLGLKTSTLLDNEYYML